MAMPVLPVKDGDWTWDDLQSLPDSYRYEVVDGFVVVSPLPTTLHEYVVAELHALLRAVAPADLAVLGPVGIELGRTLRGPDVLVVQREVLRTQPKTLQPRDVLLAVEVMSPGSVTTDRITKRHEYAAAGIPSYWVVEPDAGPLLVVHRGLVELLRVTGDETAELDLPFRVRVTPSALLP